MTWWNISSLNVLALWFRGRVSKWLIITVGDTWSDAHVGRYRSAIAGRRGPPSRKLLQVKPCIALLVLTVDVRMVALLVGTIRGGPPCRTWLCDKGGTPLILSIINASKAGLFNSFLKYTFLTISHTGISLGHPSNYLCKHLCLTSIIGQEPTQSLCYGISYKVLYNLLGM